MQYASELLKAFNRDGKSSNQIEIYRQSALKIGSEIAGFDDKMSDKKYLDKAKEDAKYSASESANGFPLLIIRNENKKGVLSNGCVSLEQIDAQLSQSF